jgi:putative FmdB family regulatory protein
VPLFDYRCGDCGTLTEVFRRGNGVQAALVCCARCGSGNTARAVSRFSFRAPRRPKYSEEFREQAAPFLMSRPGAQEYFAEGSGSPEAKLHALTERIGERVDSVLKDQVFKDLEA